MAKLSSIVKNERRKKLIEKFAPKRKELRLVMQSQTASVEEKNEAMEKLQKMSRNSCATRYRSRCLLTGRPRGNYQMFQLSRMKFRELALKGMIPGITKASW